MATTSPDTILINSYGAFTNIFEQGDVLFLVEYDIQYHIATAPNGIAAQYFHLIVYNTDGVTPLGYQGAIDFNNRLVGVYFNAYAAYSAGITPSAKPKLVLKVAGIPGPFSVPVPVSDTKTLNDASFWFDGTGLLRTRIISIMGNIEAHDTVAYGVTCTYLAEDVNGDLILAAMPTTANPSGWSGQNMVLAWLPRLNNVIPSMFESTLQSLTPHNPTGTGAYQGELTMVSKLGAQSTAAFVGIGTTFGISTQWAAGLFWALIMSIAAMIIFVYSGNSLAAMILTFPFMMIGNYLGIIPLVVTFTLTILLVIYVGYHIYLRGLV